MASDGKKKEISWIEPEPEHNHFYASNNASRADLVVDNRSDSSESKGCWNTWQEYPKHVLLIVGNEFCERFSYYGMRTVLTLYIVNILGFSEANSVALYHGFIVLCYTTPVLGSILADGYIGKFHTILWVSLLYASGNIVLAVAATFPEGNKLHPGLDFLGLIIIGFGTGGIKPCVSAFGGDQFKKGQERLLETFFSVFYFSINAGSTISSFITPYFRDMPCLNADTCFSLAFGVPAILMVVSVIFFVIGSRWYTRYPPKENVMLEVIKVMKSALSNKRFFEVDREHWLDHHLDNHSCDGDIKCQKYKVKQLAKGNKEGLCFQAQFVDDIKAFLRVSVMYLPVPVFWALYDLQGSRWVLQGVQMDGHLWHNAVLLPDQMPTINAVLIMLFIPLFQGVVYPAVKKVGINFTPLRKMTVGGLLAAASFVIAMFVQIKVNATLGQKPAPNGVHLAFINMQPCNLTIISQGSNKSPNPVKGFPTGGISVPKNGSHLLDQLKFSNGEQLTLNWRLTYKCKAGQMPSQVIHTNVTAGKSWYTTITPEGYGTFQSELIKPTSGGGQFKINVNYFVGGPKIQDYPFVFCAPNGNFDAPCDPYYADYMASINVNSMGTSDIELPSGHHTPFVELKPNYWRLYKVANKNSTWNRRTSKADLAKLLQYTNVGFYVYGQGGIYTMTVAAPNEKMLMANGTEYKHQNRYQIVSTNTVSILLQIPQYVVVTAAEILFSITGLEFSYSQAPNSMKSVIQAVWLLTVAGGDLIDLIIAELRIFDNLAYELLLYAALMAVVIIIFALMAQFWYTYVEYTRDEDEDDSDIEDETET